MLTSYDTIEQAHQTIDLWEKHGGECIHVGIPERLFHYFFHILVVIYVLDIKKKQGDTIFHLIRWGLYCYPNAPNND